MLDELLPLIESVQSRGGFVLLKWDGERPSNRCTVVITQQSTDYVFRQDSDDIVASLQAALSDYQAKHGH